MALQCFKSKRFGEDALARIDLCNEIIAEYQEQGLTLTLRQLYYQLVTRNAITNEEKSYKNLGTLLSDARLAGLVDWEAIEDRVRQPVVPMEFASVEARIEAALNNFRLPRWKGQSNYVELWVEKDALANVLAPIASKHHVTLMVNRGYSSSSAMYEASQRFREACNTEETLDALDERLQAWKEDGVEESERHARVRDFLTHAVDVGNYRWPHLLYLGDHDPSGEDMVRDIADRLKMFGVVGLQVKKLALTMEQVRQYKPPPNPAKITDSRAKAYIEKHGDKSWEVDALPPNVLTRIIERAIESLKDSMAWAKVINQEMHDRELVRKAIGDALKGDSK